MHKGSGPGSCKGGGLSGRCVTGWRATRAPMRRALLLAALGWLGAGGTAWATGSFDCTIDDARVSFDAQAAFSHGMGAAFNNFHATLALKAKDAPPEFRELELDGGALVHHWFHGRDLRLHLYYERSEPPFGSLELVMETRGPGGDDTGFAGRYRLKVFVAGQNGARDLERTYTGRAACSAG